MSVAHQSMRPRRTNGFVERMNRTFLAEFFRVAGHTTWYVTALFSAATRATRLAGPTLARALQKTHEPSSRPRAIAGGSGF